MNSVIKKAANNINIYAADSKITKFNINVKILLEASGLYAIK